MYTFRVDIERKNIQSNDDISKKKHSSHEKCLTVDFDGNSYKLRWHHKTFHGGGKEYYLIERSAAKKKL